MACPNKQTTILIGGDAPPNASLIAYLAGRPVGGGSSRGDGSWRIPLFVNERPGVYPVDVKVRDTRALVVSFTCYVDVPISTAEPAMPISEATGTPSSASPTPSSTPTSALAKTESATATITRTPTATRSATTQTTQVTATATATATTTITTPTTTATASTAQLKISDLFCRDPYYPDDSEYIELRNDSTTPLNLLGWTVVNTSRSGVSYTFPGYTMEAGPNTYLTLYSGIGDNLAEFAEFYWNRTDQLWYDGDQAELRDPAGYVIDSYTVPVGCVSP
ncbi:lamin tail domain-containing protein [Chloroflexales bacterium ZM16-3]|nr:lamin tail domain-containing protein [Chloroflexales bacterium ZM16-3]